MKWSDIGMIICVIALILCILGGIDSKQINTNKEVDCIDGGDNFISEQTCYKRVICGNKFRLFDSKYCGKEYAFSGDDEE